MRKTLCTVKLFFGNTNMDVEIYLDLDGSVEDQLFDIFGDKITDWKWKEKTLSTMIREWEEAESDKTTYGWGS